MRLSSHRLACALVLLFAFGRCSAAEVPPEPAPEKIAIPAIPVAWGMYFLASVTVVLFVDQVNPNGLHPIEYGVVAANNMTGRALQAVNERIQSLNLREALSWEDFVRLHGGLMLPAALSADLLRFWMESEGMAEAAENSLVLAALVLWQIDSASPA